MKQRCLKARPRVLLPLIAALALVLGMAPSAQAIELNVPKYKQVERNWCWAASVKMVKNYISGSSPSQCTVVKRGKGTSACADVSASAGETRTALSRSGLNSAAEDTLASIATINNNLVAGRPLIVGYTFWGGGGHMVVVREWRNTLANPYLTWNDPADGTEKGRYYDSFKQNNTWIVTATIKGIKES